MVKNILGILSGPGLLLLLRLSSSSKIFATDKVHEFNTTKDKSLVSGVVDRLKTFEKYWEKQLEISSPPESLILLYNGWKRRNRRFVKLSEIFQVI